MASVRTRPAVIAVLAILAIAVAAATLNSAVVTGGEFGTGTGSTGGDASGPGRGSGEGTRGPLISFGFGAGFTGALPTIPLPCLRILTHPLFVLGLLAASIAVVAVLYRRSGLLGPIGFLAGIGPPAAFAYALLTSCGAAEPADGSLGDVGNLSAMLSVGVSDLAGGGSSTSGAPALSFVLFGVLGIALVVAVALLLRSTADDEAPTGEPAPPEATTVSIGRAAGRAADRIEGNADLDNEVYRAWREMTTHLDVANPDSSTPAEFASAAVEAGMDGDDVSELTSLFEEVRYGVAEPTADREERAVAALRRIESAYAGGSR